MTEIAVSPEEIASQTLNTSHRAAAVAAILEDGFVVLKGVVNPAHLDIVHERMIADIHALVARPDAPFNWNTGNLQQDPPPMPPYLFADILLNPQAIAVTHALLGSGVKNMMYTGNTAMPSEERQPVHADGGHLWPILDVAHPPARIIINISTVDVSPENASTEIWPGTHNDVTILKDRDIKLPADALEARRKSHTPLQPTLKRGDMLLRDSRLWHAGMPNRTLAPRPMIAMMHVTDWMETGHPLTFPVGTESFFEHPVLRTMATFTSEPIDYIRAPGAYEYKK